ncbi:hypothetical protein BH10PSE2_BH10PSE2_25300 [soil metagenome]
MKARTLKIALAVSVAVNVFALAGGATAWVLQERADAAPPSRSGPDGGFRDMIGGVDPAVRDRVRATLRTSALAARPDFEEARQARRQAIALTQVQTLDPAAVNALLDRSRLAEMRGRSRLERDATALLATLDTKDRAALNGLLARRGRGGGGGVGGGGDHGRGPGPGRDGRNAP